MSARYRSDRPSTVALLVGAALVLVVAFGIRLAITGGDIGCVFAQDPALCVAVKDVR